MLFWVGVLVVLVVVGAALSWGLRGYEDREHEPGSQRLRVPSRPGVGQPSGEASAPSIGRRSRP